MKLMKFLATFIFISLPMRLHAQASPTLQKNPVTNLPIKSSYDVECTKARDHLKKKVICYQCCVGELQGKQCEEFGDPNKKKQQKCNCNELPE